MLMMPWIAGLTRARLPLGVAFLVLINVLVFFGFQARDHRREALAVDYYLGSVLLELEPPAYEVWLRGHGRHEELDQLHALMRSEARPAVVMMIERDAAFLSDLHAGRVIDPGQPRHEDWQRARQQFDAMWERLFTRKYAFDSAHPKLLTALTSQFLHGSGGHLFGNMLVLVLIAPAVEALLGSFTFVVVYLLGGLGAAALFMLEMQAGSSGGAIVTGASGAISAVMAAFAVLLGMRRIPFFVFAIVYFDIVRAPALLALPLWLANEAAQYLWFSAGSGVAYSAHFGGLLTGALLVLPWRKLAQARLAPAAEAPRPVPAGAGGGLAQTLHQARRLMAAQRFEEARRAYLRAASDPACPPDGLREAFNLLRLTPAAPEYHQFAAIVCASREEGVARLQLLRDCYNDYIRQAKPAPRLGADTLAGLIPRFVQGRCPDELESCMRALCRLAPGPQPGLDAVFRQGIAALRAAGRLQQAAELAALLRSAGG